MGKCSRRWSDSVDDDDSEVCGLIRKVMRVEERWVELWERRVREDRRPTSPSRLSCIYTSRSYTQVGTDSCYAEGVSWGVR